MCTQKIIGFMVIMLIALQATAVAQDDRPNPSGDPPAERIKARPVISHPSRTAIPERTQDRLPMPEQQLVPVRHLWGDLDNDGPEDLFVLDQGGNLLFRNLGDRGFEEVTPMAFPDGAGCGGTGFFGDYNGDRLLDLFLFLEEGFFLFCNEGKLHFSDVTETLGLPTELKDAKVQLKDYNGDGFGDLLVRTPEGDRIFRNRGGRSFGEIHVTGPRKGFGGMGPVPPIQSPGGSAGPGAGSRGGMTADTVFLNDNSPGSVGIGVPEVEGGDDATIPNDIVDGTVTGDDIQDGSVAGVDIANGTISSADIKNGTITGTDIADESITDADIQDGTLTGADIQNGSLTGSDIANGSVEPGKVIGTAATLKGDQNFDGGTLYIDAMNDRVGMGTASPIAPLEINTASGDALVAKTTDTSAECSAVYGYTKSTSGRGIFGLAYPASGTTYGVHGQSNSSSGSGVFGLADAKAGFNIGVYGKTKSPSGKGVFGECTATTGTNYGVLGESYSTEGRGVYGAVLAGSGTNYGVKGDSYSSEGIGVYGYSLYIGAEGVSGSNTGIAYGVRGECSSSEGRGVYGNATASSGTTYGVRGLCDSTSGRGVYGECTATTGTNYGIKGHSASFSGTGVHGESYNIGVEGHSTATSGALHYGVKGVSDSDLGNGVYGMASALSGWCSGVSGATFSPDGYGMYSNGDFGCAGTKYFVQPHPTDASKEIRFVCLEGNESGTYFRGSSRLENGRAVIEVPEEFRLVTEEEGLTVQVTPVGIVQIGIAEKNLNRIVIVGKEDVEFDYFVNGVRRGFAGLQSIRENHSWVPEYKDRPFGTQYPATLRKILVENGTLNPDFTPNKKTAARMGWNLGEFKEEKSRLADRRPLESKNREVERAHRQDIKRDARAARPDKSYGDPDRTQPDTTDSIQHKNVKSKCEDKPNREKTRIK